MGLAETAPSALMAPTWTLDVVRSEVVVVASEAVSAGESRAPARVHVVAAIAAGGAIGGLVRAGAVKLAPLHEGRWPWATFCVNIAGCLILGYAVTHLLAPPPPAASGARVRRASASAARSRPSRRSSSSWRGMIHDGHGGLAARLRGRHAGRRARGGRARERARAAKGALMGTALFVLAIAVGLGDRRPGALRACTSGSGCGT